MSACNISSAVPIGCAVQRAFCSTLWCYTDIGVFVWICDSRDNYFSPFFLSFFQHRPLAVNVYGLNGGCLYHSGICVTLSLNTTLENPSRRRAAGWSCCLFRIRRRSELERLQHAVNKSNMCSDNLTTSCFLKTITAPTRENRLQPPNSPWLIFLTASNATTTPQLKWSSWMRVNACRPCCWNAWRT